MPSLSADGSFYGGVSDFLAEQVFGRWDLVLYYDLARGLRVFAGRDGARLKEMFVRAQEKVGDLALARKDPSTAFAMLDRFVQNNIMAGEESVSAAILIDHASFLLPSGEPGRLSPSASQQVVTLLNWAASPHVKRLNMAMVLMDESAAALSERITSNPYVSDIEVPMPDEAARARFLHYALEGRDIKLASDFSEADLARLTAGISCVDINVGHGSSPSRSSRDIVWMQLECAASRKRIDRTAMSWPHCIEDSCSPSGPPTS